jgi:amino acid adenylation domain-containing protein
MNRNDKSKRIRALCSVRTSSATSKIMLDTQVLEQQAESARLFSQPVGGCLLSPQQQRIWSLQQIEGGAPYRVQGVVSIRGELDVARLKTAVGMIVGRHAILRTAFRYEPSVGVLMQVIDGETSRSVRWEKDEDLSGQDAETQRMTSERLLNQLSAQAFDFADGPLLRLKLLTCSPRERRMLVALPALCVDSAGLDVLVREIGEAYGACFNRQELDGEPTQYALISQWLNELLELEEIQPGKDFWRASGISNLHTSLPFEHRRNGNGFDPQVLRLTIREDVAARCELLVAQRDASLADCLLACWQILLRRYTGQPEIVVGAAFDGRTESDLESVVGTLTKYLPLRVELQLEQSFERLLRETAQASRDAATWQEAFTWDSLATSETVVEPPYASYCFALQRQAAATDAVGVSFYLENVFECVDRYKLKLVCRLVGGSLQAEVHYDSQYFDVAAIEHLSRKFEILLGSASRNSDASIETLELLDEAERDQLLVRWNQTRTDYPRQLCIHQLFEAQAASTPDAIAVLFEDSQLTYAELNRRANQLAHYLRGTGVSREVSVGLCLERSAEMAVALLGILKAGGAYVPLDPQYPLERLAVMIDDAAITVLLTQENLLDALPARPLHVVCIDSDWKAIAGQSEQSPQCHASADNLAYIIYTSGSTGQPKGIGVTHRNVVRLVKETNYATFDVDEVFLQLAPISFDAATFEIWGALLNGGRLAVAPPHSLTLEELGHTLQRYGVTTLWLTAGLFQMMVDEQPQALRGLRQLLAGGDVLSAHHVARAIDALAGGAVVNGYGPTETTTFACCYRMTSGEHLESGVPIGRPVANAEAYVLDKNLEAVPVGLIGELYIGGDGVARGYHQRADLTAERFIPHPFSTQTGARLYRTGDLARYRADGNVEFIGRFDAQVKVRGFRVELGEIESALLSHEAIREAVVVVREESASDKRLVAYVVADEPARATAGQLRGFLQARLPEYMIPSTFALLEHLPLTPNGKVDRRSLSTQELPPESGRERFVAARTPVEEILVNIWSQLLGLQIVSVTDNFFELGGHSLLATRLISRIKEAFGLELPLQSVFEQPTLEAFARSVETAHHKGEARHAPPVVAARRDVALPLSFAQQRLWFFDRMQPSSALYNIPLALSLRGALDVGALRQVFTRVVARHEALRTTFALSDDAPVQLIHPPTPAPVPLIDLSAVVPEAERRAQARRLVNEEAQRPFDLAAGPLLRASLLRLAPDEHIWLLTMHHIVSDWWSIEVLVREVATLYAAQTNGREAKPELPELSVQYADFAVWQREWLQGVVLERQLTYWREQLAGAASVLELPTDRVRPAVSTYRGGQFNFRLDGELTAGVKELSRRQGATMFMTLLAAFQVLLYRYSGQESINVGTPIANRNHLEIEPLIGFFVNTLVMRADLSGRPSFNELLRRTRATALGAYTHQDVPFERLVEELHTERSLSHSPLFQVMFAFHNTSLDTLELPRLQSVLLEQDGTGQMGKFELSLAFSEEADGLKGSFVYQTDLFDAATIERMATHLRGLLESIVTNPERKIEDLSLMNEAELRQLLCEAKGAQRDFAQPVCVHQLFEAQVAQTPEAVALVCQGEQVSYTELNRRANQLAHYLRGLGVGPEATVGLCLPRSVEMVVGLLAVFKAGGAYVPLDPQYPMERHEFIIEDSGIKALVTQQCFVETLPAKGATVVCLDTDGERIAQMSAENTGGRARPEDLAYLLYTSGSTGRPKGVLVEHGQLVNTLRASQHAFAFNPSEVMLCMAPSSFDIFFFELLNPLLTGGRSLMLTHAEVLDATILRSMLADATAFEAVPGLMRLILNAVQDGGGPQQYPKIRQVFTGGDAVPHELVKEILKAFPAAEVFIIYGPTEGTIICASHAVERGQPTPHQMIGKPLLNMTLRLYDKNRNLVPVGVAGEIYIGGACVARGYLKREELTREKFVIIDGERFYRSGDLARRMSDGNIVFLGRGDAQVKVRGFRIEIGEVEAALEAHASVRECVVVAHDDALEGKRLVAYVVADAAQPPTASDLRGYLQQRLPEHMIPSAFVLLDGLPITVNGKVDRQALLMPSNERPELTNAYVAPRTEMEWLVSSVWQETLGVEGLGTEDNFFDVGGNSLLLVRVQSKLRSLLAREVSVLDLFKYSTISALAAHLSAAQTSKPTYEQAHVRTRKQKDFLVRQKQKARERRIV